MVDTLNGGKLTVTKLVVHATEKEICWIQNLDSSESTSLFRACEVHPELRSILDKLVKDVTPLGISSDRVYPIEYESPAKVREIIGKRNASIENPLGISTDDPEYSYYLGRLTTEQEELCLQWKAEHEQDTVIICETVSEPITVATSDPVIIGEAPICGIS